MLRRLPIMPLIFAVTLGLFALTSAVAQVPGTQPQVKPTDIKPAQDENAKLYKRFADELLALAQRWEKSDNPDERDRAKALRAALNLAAEKGVERLFKELQEGLANKNPSGGDFSQILGKDTKLRAALDEILRTLETEDDADRLKREIAELKKLIEAIEKIKRDQENVRARTDINKSDPNQLAKDQKDLTGRTKDVANQLGGKDNKGGQNAGEPKDDRAEPKPEAKPGDANPENKPDTKEDKSGTKPSGDGMPMAGGMGDPKAGGEQKPSPMGGMPAGGDKESPKGGMNAGDPKPGGEQKPMGGMDPKNPMDQKPTPGDSKAQGDGKGDPKPSAGMPGGDSKPMSGMPMDGMPSGGSPSQSKPSPGGMPGGGMPPPPGGGQQQPKDQAQEDVQKAVPPQQEAEQDIRKGDNNQASKNQDEAIKQLEKALKELEKRLKQLREKELEKLLANLEERVGRMLRMQEEVLAQTINIDKVVVKNNGQKTTAEIQKSQTEADKELQIIAEADKALKLMEGEGSAVVFAGVLTQVRGDMVAVQNRLNAGRVEKQTQDIEQDIIDQLKMMKEALKKAKQDLKDPPKPGDPKDGNGKQPDKKLIDLINELKLIKSLQEQVNKRTISYSKQDPGEQAKDPLVQSELQQLAERQRILQEMLHKIATQANQ